MDNSIKKPLSALLVLSLCASLGTETGFAANPSATHVETVSNATEIADVIQEHWDNSYFDQVVIDPKEHAVAVDGTQTTLEDTLDLNKQDASKVLESADAAEDYFADSVYDATTTKSGDVIVTAPYQTMRIIVFTASSPTDTYGAVNALYDAENQQYILQYDSQEATQDAYQTLQNIYGKNACVLDEVVNQDDLLMDTTSTNTASCYSWGATLMGLDDLKDWDNTNTSDNTTVTVAVLDTGIDTTNTFFSTKTILPASRNFSSDDTTDLSDGTGHGTHVCGIVADCTPDSVSLLMLRVFNNDGNSTALTISTALKYAVEQKADIINLSFGWSKNSASENTRALINPVLDTAYQANIPIFCAAGNEHSDVSTSYPASSTKTIAVSSINPNTSFDDIYSNFGDKIDFAAPGVDITSAKAGGQVCVKTGTSMATPHLSAAAAYIKLHNPDISIADLYQTFKNYATDLGDPGKDDLYGWGYIDLSTYYEDNVKGTHSLSDMTANLSQTSYPCDGTAHCPAVTVWENGAAVSPHNYTVTYRDNVNPGTATVTITGIGNYQSTLIEHFTLRLGTGSVSKVTNGKSGITVQWNQIPGATGYYVYRRTNSGSWSRKATITSGKTLTWTDKHTGNGTRYTYTVKAYCGDSAGAHKNPKTIYRLTTPTIYHLYTSGSGRLTVQWSRNSKTSGYQISYSTQKSFASSKTITVSSCRSYKRTVSRLSHKKYYFVRVRSYKRASGITYYSGWSTPKAVKTK